MKHTATQSEVNSMNSTEFAAYLDACKTNRVTPYEQQPVDAVINTAGEAIRNATPSFTGVKPARKTGFTDDLTCNPQIVQVIDGYLNETSKKHWLICLLNDGVNTVKKRINVAELIAECQASAPTLLSQLFTYDAGADTYTWHGGVKLSYNKGQVAFHAA
ncbi:MAG: hypothetical protein ACO294_12685 [Methylococcales bacterium]